MERAIQHGRNKGRGCEDGGQARPLLLGCRTVSKGSKRSLGEKGWPFQTLSRIERKFVLFVALKCPRAY